MSPYRERQPTPLVLPKDGDIVEFEGRLYCFRRSAMKCASFSEDGDRKIEHVTLLLEDVEWEARRKGLRRS